MHAAPDIAEVDAPGGLFVLFGADNAGSRATLRALDAVTGDFARFKGA